MQVDPASSISAAGSSDPVNPHAGFPSEPITRPVGPEVRRERVSVSFDESHVLVYRFLDQQTGDLVQQIPPEEILKIVRNIQQLLLAEQQNADSHVDLKG